MTVYTWLVVLLVAVALLFNGNKKNSKMFIIISFLLLFAVMGLRDVYAFGSDASGSHGSYPIIYRNIGHTEWRLISGKGENNYNIGFAYLTKLIYEITNGNYQAYITIISLFVTASYTRFTAKYSPSPIQSILCFLGLLYYSVLFDALKQALAMAVLLLAFDAIIEKKPFKFIVLTIISALFHFPAIVFLPAYWIGRMQIGRKYLTVLAAILLITFVFRNQLLNLMLRAYSNGESTASMEGIRFLRNKALLMIAIVVIAVWIRPPRAEDTVYNATLIFAGVAIVFQTFCGYNNIFERLADYYFHTSIVLIPLIFEINKEYGSLANTAENDQLMNYAAVFVCAVAIWRFLSYMNNAWIFSPYRFLWQ